jgi:hypothetical protein
MVVSGTSKLIRPLEGATLELYDLDDDPLERVNLASQDAQRAEALTARLETWSGSFPNSFSAFGEAFERPTDEGLDPAVVESFRALGYLD